LAAGCGSSSTKTPAPQGKGTSTPAPNTVALVTAASAKTLDKRSSRVDSTVVSTSGLSLQSTGAYDYRRANAVLDVTIRTSGRTTKQHMVLVSGVAYVSLPGLGKGGKYLRLNLSDLTGRSGGTSFDQGTQLALLRGATSSLHTVGSEPVRGVPTTHIAGTLDRQKALSALPDAKVRAALLKLSALVKTPNQVPVDLWIDSSGVLRKLRQKITLPAQKVMSVSIPASTVTTTNEFYDFGVPVTAVAPPASALMS
jgi:hypothetical protein